MRAAAESMPPAIYVSTASGDPAAPPSGPVEILREKAWLITADWITSSDAIACQIVQDSLEGVRNSWDWIPVSR